MNQQSFYPENETELQNILQRARAEGAHVQPYAGAYNWGYGEDNTDTPNTWKIYFSKMRKIISFDPIFGIIRIEPGVTQADLENYLIENGLNYYVPNTGAGGRGSILGNALERGFGIAPMQDHASSLVSIRGFFANGSSYQSSLIEVDRTLSECFSWGVGPQLDLLASQNSWIFISEASIQLVAKSPKTDLLVANFNSSQLAKTVDGLRKIMQTHPGIIGSIKLFNKNQVLRNPTGSSLNAQVAMKKDWFLIITVYSTFLTHKSNVNSVKASLKTFLPGLILRLNRRRIDGMFNLLNFFRFSFLEQLRTSIYDLSQFLRLGEGYTTEVGYKALDPNYNPELGQPFNMNQLSKRLVWFSPICPLNSVHVDKLLNLINQQKENAPCDFRTMTWTVLNAKTIALVIPLLFDKDKEKEFWDFYKDLLRTLKTNGFIPYRFHLNMIPFLTEELLPKHFNLNRKIKAFLDPQNLLIPDKY